LAIDAE
jgi:hypothetical protein